MSESHPSLKSVAAQLKQLSSAIHDRIDSIGRKDDRVSNNEAVGSRSGASPKKADSPKRSAEAGSASAPRAASQPQKSQIPLGQQRGTYPGRRGHSPSLAKFAHELGRDVTELPVVVASPSATGDSWAQSPITLGSAGGSSRAADSLQGTSRATDSSRTQNLSGTIRVSETTKTSHVSGSSPAHAESSEAAPDMASVYEYPSAAPRASPIPMSIGSSTGRARLNTSFRDIQVSGQNSGALNTLKSKIHALEAEVAYVRKTEGDKVRAAESAMTRMAAELNRLRKELARSKREGSPVSSASGVADTLDSNLDTTRVSQGKSLAGTLQSGTIKEGLTRAAKKFITKTAPIVAGN